MEETNLLCNVALSQLVVVDIQTRLAGAMSEADRQRVIGNSATLIQGANSLGIPLTVTEQYPKGLGHTDPALTEHLHDNHPVIDKTCFACSGAESFISTLDAHEGRRQIILCGMESHVCVLQTALELQRLGYSLFVVEDATCSRTDANHRNAMARLRQAGVVVSNTESVLFEWLRDARHEQFKQLSALIK